VKFIALIGVCFIAGAAHAQNCKTPKPSAAWLLVQKQTLSEEDGAWKNDSLRKELMKAANMTSSTVAPQLGWMPRIDNVTPLSGLDALDYLRKQAATRGAPFPTKSTVGLAGLRATFLLVQRDTALLRTALHRFMEAGPDEGIKPDIAVMEDRVRVLAGRKQLYGTQMDLVDGKYVPMPIEDSSHVDLRREGANLPPLAWSVCNANSR
jgi:hypothetical protein